MHPTQEAHVPHSEYDTMKQDGQITGMCRCTHIYIGIDIMLLHLITGWKIHKLKADSHRLENLVIVVMLLLVEYLRER